MRLRLPGSRQLSITNVPVPFSPSSAIIRQRPFSKRPLRPGEKGFPGWSKEWPNPNGRWVGIAYECPNHELDPTNQKWQYVLNDPYKGFGRLTPEVRTWDREKEVGPPKHECRELK